jgi:hypothetical protein
MKAAILSTGIFFSLIMTTINGYTQRLDSGPTDRAGRIETDLLSIPKSSSPGARHREPSFTPDSHIPPRSPDLGQPYFPLSPSIGPGSGLLGPEAGRGPGRLRSAMESDGVRSPSNPIGSIER